MYYRLERPEIVQSPAAHAEWAKLLGHVGHLTWHEVVVGPPYKEHPHRAWVIDVPDWVAPLFAERVAPLIFAAPLLPGECVLPRPEWEHQALLLPPPGGMVIPTELLNNEWASAHLEVYLAHTEKRGTRVVGRLRYAAPDADDERLSRLPALHGGVPP